MIERINELMRKEGLSELQFAKRIGVPQSSVNGYLSGKNTPPTKFLTSVITEFSDVSAEWLMRGEGPMYISDLPSTDHDDSDEVLELKAEITRLRVEREEMQKRIIELEAITQYQEKRLDKMLGILHQEPGPRVSMVAEEHEYNTNNSII